MDRTQHPADNEFSYYLEVNDHHDNSDGITWFPRYGWACLWRHNPEKPVCDANPYPEVYVQEQSFTYEDYVNTEIEDDWKSPIASDGVMYPHQISDTDGWEAGPSRLWDFIEAVRDKYYENGFDESDFPVRAITNRMEDTYEDSSFDEVCEIYFRNRDNDIEYIMWNSNELYDPEGNPNSELIQKILVELASAYETPGKFIDDWAHHQVQISDTEF